MKSPWNHRFPRWSHLPSLRQHCHHAALAYDVGVYFEARRVSDRKRWRHHEEWRKDGYGHGYWWLLMMLFMKLFLYGYGSIPIHTIFRGMNIHLPAILMFTRGTRFWHTAIYIYITMEKWRWLIVLNGYWWLILMLLMDRFMVITPWLWLLLIYQSSIWIWLSLMLINIFPYSLGPHS